MLLTRDANLCADYSDALASRALAPLWTALHPTVQADLRGHQLATKAAGGLTCPTRSGRIAAK